MIADSTEVIIDEHRFLLGTFLVDRVEAAGKLSGILDQLPKRLPWRAKTTVLSRLKEVPKEIISRKPRLAILGRQHVGFGADVILGFGFQWYEDSYNPNFTGGQQFVRASISGGIGTAFSTYVASLACGPGVPACLILAGTAASKFWADTGQPLIFETFSYFQSPTNLKPLQ